MAKQEQLRILKKGVQAWHRWRMHHSVSEIDLSEANLSGINLGQITIAQTNFVSGLIDAMPYTTYILNLSGAILNNINFNDANLNSADFSNAILYAANLRGANLSNVILKDADLREADLTNANLTGTNLRGASFSGTNLSSTIFGLNDLSSVKAIEKVKHHSASILSVETIYKSKGEIPEVFLRGCGLRDIDIEYAKLASPGLDPEQVTDITYRIHQLYVKGGIQYYSCFISYNSKDETFARRLHNDLQENGVRCWFAPEDMKIGDQIRPTIDQQIRLRDKLLVILSENSVKSEWVGDEVEAALEEESATGRLVLFPIRLDDAVMDTRDDWAAKVKRRRLIGDFSNWKDEGSYQKAFERLLRDLKANSGETER